MKKGVGTVCRTMRPYQEGACHHLVQVCVKRAELADILLVRRPDTAGAPCVFARGAVI